MPSDRFAFIVRVWLEESSSPSGADPVSQLRGSVQTANADKVRYFTSFEDLPHLLRELSNLDTAISPTQPSQSKPSE